MGKSIEELQIGILGFGRIGQELAKKLENLVVKIFWLMIYIIIMINYLINI